MFNIKLKIVTVLIFLLILFLPIQQYIFYENTLLFLSLIKLEIALALMCIPIFLYFKYSNSKYEVPLIPFFCIYFITSYILPFGFFDQEVFNTWIKLCMNENIVVPQGINPNDAEFCSDKDDIFISKITNSLLFISLAFLTGYLISKKLFSSIDINLKFFEIENILIIKILIIFLFILILIKKFIFTGHIPILSQSTTPLTYLMSGLCVYIICKDLNKLKFLFILPIFIIIIKEILDGYISFPLLLSFYSLTIYFVFERKFPFLFIIILFVLINFAHFFKYEYRKNLNKLQNASNSEKILTYKNSVINILKDKDLNTNILNNLQRIAHPINSFVLIHKKTPSKIPFWNGYSFKIFATKFIPRVFWKDKPSDTIGNEVGRRYEILSSSDKSTSWNLPVINEFYVNFGKIGLIIGTFLLSIFMYLISVIFKSSKNSNVLTVISIYITFKLFFLESHLSLIFGNLFQNLVLILILVTFFNFKKFKNVKSLISNK